MASTIPGVRRRRYCGHGAWYLASPRGDIRPQGVSAAFTPDLRLELREGQHGQTPYNRLDILYVAFVHIDKKTKKLDFESVGGARNHERPRVSTGSSR